MHLKIVNCADEGQVDSSARKRIKLQRNKSAKAKGSIKGKARAQGKKAARHPGNVVPHDIPTEETRGARERRKHAGDADFGRATRHLELNPTELNADDAGARPMSFYTTFPTKQRRATRLFQPPPYVAYKYTRRREEKGGILHYVLR